MKVKIPHHIHFVVPKEITAIQQMCIQKARELHPGWEVHVWQDDEMPVASPLASYLPRCQSGAQRADLIRLAVMESIGGVYLDSDVLLRKPLDFVCEYDELVVCSEDGESVTNAFFASPPGHHLLKRMIDHLLAVEPDWSLPPNQTTGPALFTAILRESTEYSLLPREAFYPYPFFAPRKARRVRRHAVGEHLWAGSWLSNTKGAVRRLGNWARWIGYRVEPRVRVLNYLIRAGIRYAAAQVLPSCVVKDESIIGATCVGDRVVCLAGDVVEKPVICLRGFREIGMEAFMVRVLRGGDFVIDVGANVGFVTSLAARLVGPFGRVYAFEPNPRAFEALLGTLVANWYQYRVVARNIAVGEGQGRVDLHVRAERPSGASMMADRAAAAGLEEISGADRASQGVSEKLEKVFVPVTSLDAAVKSGEFFRILKIDVEGAEPGVLRGARKLLEAGRVDYVIVEALPETEYWIGVAEALQEVMALGYVVGILTRTGRVQWCSSLGEAVARKVGANLVLGHREVVASE